VDGVTPRRLLPVLAAAAVVLAGCGSGSKGGLATPAVAPARVFALTGFQPSAPIRSGRKTLITFTIRAPSGKTLTAFKKCCEPHSGVDLIIVRKDDSGVQYLDADIEPNGRISEPVVFPAPGRYRIVVDVYPKQTGPSAPFNFQLFTWVTVRGNYQAKPVPPFHPTEVVDGYQFQVEGHPRLKAIDPAFLTIDVRNPQGGKAVFPTWRGALAHAIFFRAGSLDYFHTHVCSPGARYCFSALGAKRVTGSSAAAGRLKVGVLLPVAGRWRMFLLTHMQGHVVTAPITLDVG
jgi:hypothetical protein